MGSHNLIAKNGRLKAPRLAKGGYVGALKSREVPGGNYTGGVLNHLRERHPPVAPFTEGQSQQIPSNKSDPHAADSKRRARNFKGALRQLHKAHMTKS